MTVTPNGEYWMCKVGESTFRKLASPESSIVMIKVGRGQYENAFAVRDATEEMYQDACERYVERHNRTKGGKPPVPHQPAEAAPTPEPEEATPPATTSEEGSNLVQTRLDI